MHRIHLGMAKAACEAYGYELDEETEKIFTDYRKTHNQGVCPRPYASGKPVITPALRQFNISLEYASNTPWLCVCEAYGYELDEETEKIFTDYRKTHNQGVFDAYSREMFR
jgi:pyruvate-formate lyase